MFKISILFINLISFTFCMENNIDDNHLNYADLFRYIISFIINIFYNIFFIKITDYFFTSNYLFLNFIGYITLSLFLLILMYLIIYRINQYVISSKLKFSYMLRHDIVSILGFISLNYFLRY